MNTTPTEMSFKEYPGKAITDLPPKIWLIDQICGEKDFVMIFGQSGSGKSFVAIDLALCGITGQPFAGRFEVPKPLTVAYMTNEGIAGLPQRFQSAAEKHKPTDSAWSRLHVFTDLLQFVNSSGIFYLTKFVDQWNATYPSTSLDLLILDHLSGTLPGKGDSDGGAATMLHAGTAQLGKELGTGVVMIHHTGYNKSHSRGMTIYKDISDVQIQIKGQRNPYTIVCVKNKDGERWPTGKFELIGEEHSCYISWQDSVVSEHQISEHSYVTLLRDADGPLSAAEVAEKTGGNSRAVSKTLRKLWRDDVVTSSLRVSDRPLSKVNPYVYKLP